MKQPIFPLLLCGLILTLTACHKEPQYFPADLPPQHVAVLRFDEAVMNVRAESAVEDIRILYDEFPDFMPLWVEDILGIPSSDTAYLAEALPLFLGDTLYGFRETNLRVKQLFHDITPIQTELDEAFTRYLYLYPDAHLPSLTLFISGFNASILFVDDDLAAGTDMYLGSDYEYYNRVVYDYQKQTMRPECLATDVVSAYLFRNIPFTSTKNRLLENMIYRGKIMFLLSLLMPQQPDYEVMGYTRDQWRWCLKYERAIWNTIMDKRDLFTTDSKILTSYLNDGPFTQEVTQDSPGRLGTWVGWRIVESYMKHNPDITLRQLMAEGDAQMILEQSYYKP